MRRDGTVSVVTGVFNGSRELVPTLDSILRQDGVDLEYIVIDDGSTDDTWSILEQRAAEDARLKPYRGERGGLTRALIAGCSKARGEFIARQDVGDVSLPGRLREQRDLLATEPGLAFVACQCVTLGPEGELVKAAAPADGGKQIIASLKHAATSGMQAPHHGSVMFRRDSYLRAGGYRKEFYFAQDLDLWSRLIESGDLAFVPKVLYQAGYSPGSISAVHRARQVVLRDLILEATRKRRSGRSERRVLERAARVHPGDGSGLGRGDVDANYFIGSCLFARRDPAAEGYLRKALEERPFHFKARLKLLASRWRAAKAS